MLYTLQDKTILETDQWFRALWCWDGKGGFESTLTTPSILKNEHHHSPHDIRRRQNEPWKSHLDIKTRGKGQESSATALQNLAISNEGWDVLDDWIFTLEHSNLKGGRHWADSLTTSPLKNQLRHHRKQKKDMWTMGSIRLLRIKRLCTQKKRQQFKNFYPLSTRALLLNNPLNFCGSILSTRESNHLVGAESVIGGTNQKLVQLRSINSLKETSARQQQAKSCSEFRVLFYKRPKYSLSRNAQCSAYEGRGEKGEKEGGGFHSIQLIIHQR